MCLTGRSGQLLERLRPDAVIHQLTDLPQDFDIRKLKALYAANNRVRLEGTDNLVAASVLSSAVSRVVAGLRKGHWRKPPYGVPVWLARIVVSSTGSGKFPEPLTQR